ncbi:MAG: tetratricopeptide repeat protein [Acidobacteriota bacterium]
MILILFAFTLQHAHAQNQATGQHSIEGKVIILDRGSSPVTVLLTSGDGTSHGEQTLPYDGHFLYERLAPGDYLIRIERQGQATFARPVKIPVSQRPKTVFLEFRIAGNNTTTSELVKNYGGPAATAHGEIQSQVSRPALRDFKKAAEASQKGDTAQAIRHLEKAIEKAPNFYEAHNNLGVQYQRIQNWEKAVAAYQEALARRPDSVRVLLNLAACQVELGQLDSAVNTLERAIKADPRSVAAHIALGRLLLSREQSATAEEHLETATQLNPREAKAAFLLLVDLHIKLKNREKAIFFARRFGDYFPSDPDVRRIQQHLQRTAPSDSD